MMLASVQPVRWLGELLTCLVQHPCACGNLRKQRPLLFSKPWLGSIRFFPPDSECEQHKPRRLPTRSIHGRVCTLGRRRSVLPPSPVFSHHHHHHHHLLLLSSLFSPLFLIHLAHFSLLSHNSPAANTENIRKPFNSLLNKPFPTSIRILHFNSPWLRHLKKKGLGDYFNLVCNIPIGNKYSSRILIDKSMKIWRYS